MEKASQDLTLEHNMIIVMLNILERVCSSIKSRKKTDLDDLQQIVDLIRVFNGRFHNGKEESCFYPALQQAWIKKEDDIIASIILEHERARELVQQMQKAVSCNFIATHKFISSSKAFIDLQRHNIERENTILFPLADSMLSHEKQQEIKMNFRIFEEAVISKGKYDQLHNSFLFFENKYSSNTKV